MKKKAIILEHQRGNRLANQLWNDISIYAYALEKNYQFLNYCFFEEKRHGKDGKIYYSFDNYNKYFNFPANNRLISFLISLHVKNIFLLRRIKPYYKHIEKIKKANKDYIINSDEKPFYLPPTPNSNNTQIKKLKTAEAGKNDIFFCNWLFRNPVGIEKYREQIIKYFQPKQKIKNNIEVTIKELRENYEHLVGVHIRQEDYKTHAEGKLYFYQTKIKIILEQYLKEKKLNKNNICFIICSDGKINVDKFQGLNIYLSEGSAIEDLFLLAKTNIIIGSDSTFGAFASYYGNIPLIIFQKPKIDWTYYQNKTNYFENKYLSSIHY